METLNMDFSEMCSKEPSLKKLEKDIVDFRATKKRLGCSVLNDWYTYFKPRLCKLVGFAANNPELGGCDCYDAAYEHLCELLTDRRKKPVISLNAIDSQ
jgi:hypothetical protein